MMNFTEWCRYLVSAASQETPAWVAVHWVDGELRQSAGGAPLFSVENPARRSYFAEYAQADAATVEQAIAAAERAQRDWARRAPGERAAQLWQIASHIEAESDALAQLEAATTGKPIAGTRGQALAVADMFRYYAGWCDQLYGSIVPVNSAHLNYTLREPLGVVAQITPWNAPLFTAGWQIAVALATGNAVVLKPSEYTPFSSTGLAMLARAAGLPDGLINIVAGTGAVTGQPLITHETIQKVVFVGSRDTGRHVAAEAARCGTPALLELGGKSAHLVFEDADLEAAAHGILDGFLGATGQSCTAGSRLLLAASVAEPLFAAIRAQVGQWTIGDPLDETTKVGPIITRAQYERVVSMIEDAESRGASELSLSPSLTVEKAQGFYIRPRLFRDLSIDDPLMQTEVFGPVLAATVFTDEDQALAFANHSTFDLGAFIWTHDDRRIRRLTDNLRAGNVWINTAKTINVRAPFGGMGGSGFGRSSGADAVQYEYTRAKSVWHAR